jgi:hypothetical protein
MAFDLKLPPTPGITEGNLGESESVRLSERVGVSLDRVRECGSQESTLENELPMRDERKCDLQKGQSVNNQHSALMVHHIKQFNKLRRL